MSYGFTYDLISKYQQEQREKKVGAILREKAMINEQQLHESLKRQKEVNKMLGEILLEAGYIASDQLENALYIQQEKEIRADFSRAHI